MKKICSLLILTSILFTFSCKNPTNNDSNGPSNNGNTGRIFVNAEVSGGTNDGLSWKNAFTNLQDALDIAKANNEI